MSKTTCLSSIYKIQKANKPLLTIFRLYKYRIVVAFPLVATMVICTS
jgi:hypothetical protein